MKKYAFSFVILFFTFQFSFSQITFERTYGGSEDDVGYCVIQTSDNGYLVAGSTLSFGNGSSDAYLVKTDEYGDTLWTSTYGGSVSDNASSVWQTFDGGYVFTGRITTPGVGQNMFLVRMDEYGDTIWTKSYGNNSNTVGNAVQQTNDLGYIIAGSVPGDGFFLDIYVVKTDAAGDTVWTRALGGEETDNALSIEQTNDNGYIIAGGTHSFGAGGWDMYVIKLDVNGDVLWTQTYGGANDDFANFIQQTSDNGYIIVGFTESTPGNDDFYLVKTDFSGNTMWTRTFDVNPGERGTCVRQTSDNGYILVGYTYFDNHSDIYLIKTNSSGDTIWTKFFGEGDSDAAYSVAQTNDNGYIITGRTTDNLFIDNIYLIKTTENGIVTSVSDQIDVNNLYLYPNPTNGVFYVDLPTEAHNIEITNIHGQLIYSKQHKANFAITTKRIDLSAFQKGIYYVTVKSKKNNNSRKLFIW